MVRTPAKARRGGGGGGDEEGDRLRMFPPFEPQKYRRGRFAESWWGEAWVGALETTSLDTGRLSRGRTYARGGNVEGITVRPGLAQARVQGSRRSPYRTSVAVAELSDRDWERFLDTVAARAVHIAALLDRDMPPDLIEDAEAAGVRLLPTVGDLEPECDCPDWGWPCKHAAALCYQIARLLDVDPFVLLLLRGRGEQELMEELRRRNAVLATVDVEIPVEVVAVAGVPADVVFAEWTPPSIPVSDPEPVTSAPVVAVLSTSRDPQELDPIGLETIAADAAHRARVLLDACLADQGSGAAASLPASVSPPMLPVLLPELTVWRDAARMIASRPDDEELYDRVADGTGSDHTALALAIRAWQQGGAVAMDVLDEPWTPTSVDKARAHQSLEDLADDVELPPLRVWCNRWTAGDERVQARLGRDGRWYPYRQREDKRWWPDGPVERDLAAALTNLLAGGIPYDGFGRL